MHERLDSGLELLPLATLGKNDGPTGAVGSLDSTAAVEGNTSLSQIHSRGMEDSKKGFASIPTGEDRKTKDEGEIELEERDREGMRLGSSYRLYKRRFLGLGALVVFNIICALSWVLFSTISLQTSTQFNINLNQINWLANIVCGMYVLSAPFVPFLVRKYGIRGTCIAAASFLVVGAWLRYSSTSSKLSSSSAYALLFIGSSFIGVAQCFFQIVPPAFSENWFGTKERTSATMLMAVANPFGGAVGDLLAPALVSSPSDLPRLLLIVAIITTVSLPLVLLIGSRPTTPPTRSAEMRGLGHDMNERGLWEGVKILLGFGGDGEIVWRERVDFWIVAILFTVLIGFFDAFLTLTNQLFEPSGYDSNTAGFIGAAVIISGLIGALVSAPLFDRYFQFRLALAGKILVPIIGISFLSLIWAIKPANLPGIYIVCVLLGISSFIMLPVALELAAEIVWKVMGPESTSTVLYMAGNGFSVVTVVAMNALRAGPDADPPLNMKKAILFEGIFVFVFSFLVFGLRGTQSRKEVDVANRQQVSSRDSQDPENVKP